MGPSIGGPETIYYYQPQGWTEFSVETLHFFTLSFSYSVKANNISSFKWEKDKKWLSLRSLCYQSMSWCQILHILHYSHNWSKLTPKKKKKFPFKTVYNSLVYKLKIWYVCGIFCMWFRNKTNWVMFFFSPCDVLERTEIKRAKSYQSLATWKNFSGHLI